MPASWTARDERQYKAIKASCLDRDGRRTNACTRIAAATVNKRRGLGQLDDEGGPFLWMGLGALLGALGTWFLMETFKTKPRAPVAGLLRR